MLTHYTEVPGRCVQTLYAAYTYVELTCVYVIQQQGST